MSTQAIVYFALQLYDLSSLAYAAIAPQVSVCMYVCVCVCVC